MEKEQFVVHLSSNASLDIYPENKPYAFTNRLDEAIVLDANAEYEVALVNIHLPKDLMIIVENDYKSRIDVYGRTPGAKTGPVFIDTFLPTASIVGGDWFHAQKTVNGGFKEFFSRISGIEPRISGIEVAHLLHYVKDKNRFRLSNVNLPTRVEYFIRFGSRSGSVFGFLPGEFYQIVEDAKRQEREVKKTDAPLTPNFDGNVQSVVVYSDIVQSTLFGDQRVNVLDIFSLARDGNRGFHNVIYKPLSKNHLSEISIKLADQDGATPRFKPRCGLTCSLRFRKRI